MADLAPLEHVQRFVLEHVARPTPDDVPLADALGLVSAAAVVAADPVPPFANSAMDGYAVRRSDCRSASADAPVQLVVVDELPAGRPAERAVGVGEAVRIMTGAVVPEGADGIVMVEDTETDGDHVIVRAPAGDHVRPAGGDVGAGETVFEAGTELTPAHLGVLAGLGLATVSAAPRPRVGVFSTGDELVPPGVTLAPGQIRESNRPMLLALVEQAACTPVDYGILPDDQGAITDALERATAECDVVLSSGGVSMGAYDEVKVVLDQIGDMRWFQVAIKPAKPFAFGLVEGPDGTARPVFGLPGNPVSSFVSFELFARPALRHRMGNPHPFRPRLPAVAGEDLPRRPDGKTHFDRVRVHHDGERLVAVRSGAQASNVLSAMARANGLAVLPDGHGVSRGESLAVMLFDVPPTLWS